MVSLTDVDADATAAAADAGLSGATGNTTQTCPDVTLEVGVFFDGTGNNRFNVLSRAREDDSYQAALTNPALLYSLYKNGSDYNEANECGGIGRAFRSIYVDGPGTTRNQADDDNGTRFGMGRQSGVEARVLHGFRELLFRVHFGQLRCQVVSATHAQFFQRVDSRRFQQFAELTADAGNSH